MNFSLALRLADLAHTFKPRFTAQTPTQGISQKCVAQNLGFHSALSCRFASDPMQEVTKTPVPGEHLCLSKSYVRMKRLRSCFRTLSTSTFRGSVPTCGTEPRVVGVKTREIQLCKDILR